MPRDDKRSAAMRYVGERAGITEAEEKEASRLRQFRIVHESELDALGDPEPLVQGVLFRDTLAQITGASGSFKTFVALDLACSIAAGIPWQGRETTKGVVIYIVAEGAHGMRKRVAAWKAHHGLTGRPLHLLFVAEPVQLNAAANVPALVAQLASILLEGDVADDIAVKAVFIDTLARNFRGNENAAEDMNAYIQACDELRNAFGGVTVVGVHHTGWGDQERGRGSSSLQCALDTEMVVTRDGNRVTLKCRKQKEAEEFPPIQLETRISADSFVLISSNDPAGLLSANERKCLEVLSTHFGPEGATSTLWKEATGLAHSSFQLARSCLIRERYVEHAKRNYVVTAAGHTLMPSTSISRPITSNGRKSERPSITPSLRDGDNGRDRTVEPGSDEERDILRASEERERLLASRRVAGGLH